MWWAILALLPEELETAAAVGFIAYMLLTSDKKKKR